jgi:hypothetical protein
LQRGWEPEMTIFVGDGRKSKVHNGNRP